MSNNKSKVSKFKKHNFCNTNNSEVVTRCSTKKSALKNFAIPTGKQPCQNFIKKRCQNRLFNAKTGYWIFC